MFVKTMTSVSGRFKTYLLVCCLCFGFITVLASAQDASAATYAQGLFVGCDIGSMETAVHQFYDWHEDTVQMAQAAGEWDYAEGVEDGYANCSYQYQPSGSGRGVGTCPTDDPGCDV